jgi:site-specific recombinase XerC
MLTAVLTHQATYQAARQAGRKPVPVEQWSQEFLQDLQQRFPEFLQLDLADSAQQTYGWHVRQYKELCSAMGQPELPTESGLAMFIMGRAHYGYARSTIEQGLYAVSRWARDMGVDGLAAERQVQQAMKVAAKLAVPVVRQKLPLDRGDLKKMMQQLAWEGDDYFVGVRDRALFLVGWTGMFRVSELVGICWEDVVEYPQGLMLYITLS